MYGLHYVIHIYNAYQDFKHSFDNGNTGNNDICVQSVAVIIILTIVLIINVMMMRVSPGERTL